MQRTAICLVAVLALLAGCSGGVGGGSDATTTPAETPESTPTATPTLTPTPTPTPAENTSGGSNPPPTVQTRLDSVSLNDSKVLEGETVLLNATLSNREDTDGTANVSVNVGNTTFPARRVTLQAGATRTVTLYTVNTSFLDPGKQFVTVSTATDSEPLQIDIRPQNELETFIDRVRSESYTLENGTILGPDHVHLTFDAEEELTEFYKNSDLMPVPQAAAFEMATSDGTPSRVTVEILPHDRTEFKPAYKTTFNRSLATGLYNGTVDPREFRDILHQRATGEELKTYAPIWTDNQSVTWDYEKFTFFTGDRARRAQAEELAERLNSTNKEYINVVEYGLYNGTAPVRQSTRTLGPNASVSVTVQMSGINSGVAYRNFSTTGLGYGIYESLWELGNITDNRHYGERPEFARVRLLWPDGSVHSVVKIPTEMALEGVRAGTVTQYYIPLVFGPFTQEYETRYGE